MCVCVCVSCMCASFLIRLIAPARLDMLDWAKRQCVLSDTHTHTQTREVFLLFVCMCVCVLTMTTLEIPPSVKEQGRHHFTHSENITPRPRWTTLARLYNINGYSFESWLSMIGPILFICDNNLRNETFNRIKDWVINCIILIFLFFFAPFL